MVALTRIQFLRSYYLASWFNHYWTVAARALFRGNFDRSSVAECDAALSAQYGAGAILPATVNALAAKLAAPGAGAILLTVTDGEVRHTTASGRLSWTVAYDGSVKIDVTRPVPEMKDAYATLRGRARALTVGLADLEPCIAELDADLVYDAAHTALTAARREKASAETVDAAYAAHEKAWDATTAASAAATDATTKVASEATLARRILDIAESMEVPALDDAWETNKRVRLNGTSVESMAATRTLYVLMRDMRADLLARVNADLAALPPESHVVLRATVSPSGDDTIEHVESRPICGRHVEALEGCLLAVHQDFDYARVNTMPLWRVVEDFETVVVNITHGVSHVWTNSLTRVSGHGPSFRTLTSTKEAVDRLMEARRRLAYLYECRA